MNEINSEEFLDNFQKVGVYYQEILTHVLRSKRDVNLPLKYITQNKKQQETIAKVFEQLIHNPDKFTDLNIEYVNNFQNLITSSINKFIGNEETSEVNDQLKDRRFKDPEWSQNIYFDFVKQYYLITSDWMKKTVQKYDLDEDSKKYLKFAYQQFIDAVSPSNFAFSNPVVIKETLDSGLENIVKGMENFLEDIKLSKGLFNISTTNKAHFKVGRDIASTEGKVIFQNELIQLICYKPKETTYSVPLLIIPPWINKYYILDLSENNSLVKYLVDNNFQVFLISWLNPKKKHANIDFENYLKDGIIESTEQIKKLGYEKINTLGYCIGGTALTCALSYLKQTKNNIIQSASFLTTLIDFAEPGEVGVLINQHTYDVIQEDVNNKGYLDGKYLSNSFSLIRANDLIWSFFVNNYLLGRVPAAFDILHWNSDSTNLPAKMYLYYLKNMYIQNKLKEPNGLKMLGTAIDVSKIDIPTFSLAAKGDHIALWNAVYDGYKLLSGDKTFCLTDAGHVAGIVNPHDNKKYSYALNDKHYETSEEWLKTSEAHPGSWWNYWHKWLVNQSGDLKSSIKYKDLNFIEKAPGSYVKK
ncbi:MAG: class I poly(R)-hydroxyalkanoic acid synthase [Rickettsiales bacterium]|nr:MAG: class I poly(R)-hydroxyalkanoic acid synthase [Rickettsiales bacterium]